MSADTPLLHAWFEIMDSDDPDRVLDHITDDFRLSILFSKGESAAEFDGDRAGLVVYLEQREKSVLTHHILSGTRIGDTELCLGETRRDGLFEASAFIYRAEFDNGITEHEFDHVVVGRCIGEVDPNPAEASEVRWVGIEELAKELAEQPEQFAAWAYNVFTLVIPGL